MIVSPLSAQSLSAPKAPEPVEAGKVQMTAGWVSELRLPGIERPIAVSQHRDAADFRPRDTRSALPSLPNLHTPMIATYKTNFVVQTAGEYGFAIEMPPTYENCDINAFWDGKRFFNLPRKYDNRGLRNAQGNISLGSVAAAETGLFPLSVSIECPYADARADTVMRLLVRKPNSTLQPVAQSDVVMDFSGAESGVRRLPPRQTARIDQTKAAAGWQMAPIMWSLRAKNLMLDNVAEAPSRRPVSSVSAGGFDMPSSAQMDGQSEFTPFARAAGLLVADQQGSYTFAIAVANLEGRSPTCVLRSQIDGKKVEMNARRYQEWPLIGDLPTDGVWLGRAGQGANEIIGWTTINVAEARLVPIQFDVICNVFSHTNTSTPVRVVALIQKPNRPLLAKMENADVVVEK
jgi:hypothetical protein